MGTSKLGQFDHRVWCGCTDSAATSEHTHHLQQQGKQCASAAAMAGQQGSLPYELLNYFNSYYVYVWLFFEFFIFIYKGLHLPYPQSVIAGEIVMMFFVVFIDRMRIFLGSMGNKTEQLAPIIGSMILGVFSFLASIGMVVKFSRNRIA